MSFEIRPITDDEFNKWRIAAADIFAAEKEKEGVSAAEARAASEASFQQYLSKGKDSPNQFLYSITLDGRVVGTLWWGVKNAGTPNQFSWIYDIVLDPSQRGKGLGKKAMEWAMIDAKAKGFNKLGLHVFGHNKVARSLYESLGFETANLVMYKTL